jgi:23S rRNA pseudouridine1911/1915/1917 synthase
MTIRRFNSADHRAGTQRHKPPALGPIPGLAENRPPVMLPPQMGPPLDVILETPTLLAVNKPADLVCHPTKGDEWSSLIGRARLHCGSGSLPHLVHRLDRETSGLVLLAKHSAAAGELGRIWEQNRVQKTYLAIVTDHPSGDEGEIEAPLGKDESSPIAIKDCVRSDGRPAATGYVVLKRFFRDERPFALLRVRPRTGRKHQIRIHLAHAGHPIVGDKLYGGNPDHYLALVQGRLDQDRQKALITANHLLHAAELQFDWRGAGFRLVASPGREFREFLGDPSSPATRSGDSSWRAPVPS